MGSIEEQGAAAASTLLEAEADHRIANSLSLIAGLLKLRADRIAAQATLSGEEVRGLLHDAVNRITAIAALHRCLSRVPRAATVDLDEYLREICDNVSSAVAAERLELSCRSAVGAIAPGIALHLGPILSEVITNAIKHAQRPDTGGKVSVTCRRDRRRTLVVEVTDGGPGLPAGFDPKTHGGLGLRIVRLLSEQLGARYTFDSTGRGVRFRIRIPDAAR